ncbi:MAG TPA: hypothetical protein VK447_02540 [Myxococcaceae bacterium]|nr:hypothetical protein [Myxococcaceae bacterium]
MSVVYRYYPRDLYPSDPGYRDTEEHRRLVQARIQAAAEGGPWDVLLQRLCTRFPKAITNGSLGLFTGDYDAAYEGSLTLQARGWYDRYRALYFTISFLVPYYVVYSCANVVAPVTHAGQGTRHINFTFTPDEEPLARALTEEILAVFPGYEPMPPEIGFLPVPEIETFSEPTLYKTLFIPSM